MQINFRKATLDDSNEICGLVSNATAHMIGQNILQWDELYPTAEDLREDIEKGQLYAGLAENRIVVIYVLNQECDPQYKNGNWQRPDAAYVVIHRLCVHPDFQNKGIAKAALLHIEKSLRTAGIPSIRLDVFSENPYALKLYEGLGYAKTGHADWRKGRFFLMEKYL